MSKWVISQTGLFDVMDFLKAAAEGRPAEEVLLKALDAVLIATGGERGLLVVPDGPDDLKVHLARDRGRVGTREGEKNFSRTLVQKTLEKGEARLFLEPLLDPELRTSRSLIGLQLRSALVGPLWSNGVLAGVLVLHECQRRDGPFGDFDLKLFRQIHDKAAEALASVTRARALAANVAQDAATAGPRPFPELVGTHPEMDRLVSRLVLIAADDDATVLIHGESGTGKEVVARGLHAYSRRKDGPFKAANMGALSDTLLESELFGHVKGAFTGADKDRTGLFRDAHGGVLFLDEVAEAGPEVQVKLLRVLEERVVQPLGSDRTYPVDVRIVAASHRDLKERVRQNLFRADLYYRLNVVPVNTLALREHASDIPLIARHLLAEIAKSKGRAALTLSPRAVAAITGRPWYGNVRDLKNALVRASVFATSGVIEPEHFQFPPGEEQPPTEPTPVAAVAAPAARRRSTPASQEDDGDGPTRAEIEAALEAEGGRVAGAAVRLDLHRNALYRRMEKLGIPRKKREQDQTVD